MGRWIADVAAGVADDFGTDDTDPIGRGGEQGRNVARWQGRFLVDGEQPVRPAGDCEGDAIVQAAGDPSVMAVPDDVDPERFDPAQCWIRSAGRGVVRDEHLDALSLEGGHEAIEFAGFWAEGRDDCHHRLVHAWDSRPEDGVIPETS